MRYWILTHCHDNAEANFSKLVGYKNWQLNESSRIKNDLPNLNAGDQVLFYISDRKSKRKSFMGSGTVVSWSDKLTRESLGDKASDWQIELRDMIQWENPVAFEKVKDSLDFILKAPNVGLAFKDRPLIPISENDFLLVTNQKNQAIAK